MMFKIFSIKQPTLPTVLPFFGVENKQVKTSVVKRDTSKLRCRDKLELVLSEAPELPALLGWFRTQLENLMETVQPMVSNVTADLGACKDGLVYLRTRQQLLLAYCMNVCFYIILKVTQLFYILCLTGWLCGIIFF